jgi:putative tryptophan/tyrosine transport system substrate-binding protein
VRRREFITLLGGAAATWPLAAPARQSERVRQIGVLLPESENDLQSKARLAAFEQGLTKLGWAVGRTVRVDYRWAAGSVAGARLAGAELVELAPDVVLAVASLAVRAFQQVTGSIPMVFVGVSEPIAQGFVASLTRPGGNITGFMNLDWTFGAKWLEVLSEIAPQVRRAAIVFNPDAASYVGSFVWSAEAVAARLAMEPFAAAVRQPADLEEVMKSLAREPAGGLILPPDTFTFAHRKLIVELAAHYRLPALYASRFFPAEGGLVSYGLDFPDQFRLAAGYVDRILKGAKPSELPVQRPAKFELVINLKTAKALGLDVPVSVLARADEVIE